MDKCCVETIAKSYRGEGAIDEMRVEGGRVPGALQMTSPGRPVPVPLPVPPSLRGARGPACRRGGGGGRRRPRRSAGGRGAVGPGPPRLPASAVLRGRGAGGARAVGPRGRPFQSGDRVRLRCPRNARQSHPKASPLPFLSLLHHQISAPLAFFASCAGRRPHGLWVLRRSPLSVPSPPTHTPRTPLPSLAPSSLLLQGRRLGSNGSHQPARHPPSHGRSVLWSWQPSEFPKKRREA